MSPFGLTTLEYEIHRRRIVHDLDSKDGYWVCLRQRVIIFGPYGTQLTTGEKEYSGYPVRLDCRSQVIDTSARGTLRLLDRSPKTVNSAVSETQNNQQGQATSHSRSVTSGTSSGDVNTAGGSVSMNVSLMGPSDTGSVNYSHSWESSSTHSVSHESGGTTSRDRSASAEVSIKDWNAYSNLAQSDLDQVQWTWGQAYPWDALAYNQVDDIRTPRTDNNKVLKLPKFVLDRMFDEDIVLPPSGLSLFGLDFLMTASWILELPSGTTKEPTLSFLHQIECQQASSYLDQGKGTVELSEPFEVELGTNEISLTDVALEPIVERGMKNGAAIGFGVTPYIVPPATHKANQTHDVWTTLSLLSPANNLKVSCDGFVSEGNTITTVPRSSTTTNAFEGAATITISFKIADVDQEYDLSFAHWTTEPSKTSCLLRIKINEDYETEVYVPSESHKGPARNITTLSLRNLDYTSPDARDALRVGMNTIKIAVLTTNEATSPQEDDWVYKLQAISID